MCERAHERKNEIYKKWLTVFSLFLFLLFLSLLFRLFIQIRFVAWFVCVGLLSDHPSPVEPFIAGRRLAWARPSSPNKGPRKREHHDPGSPCHHDSSERRKKKLILLPRPRPRVVHFLRNLFLHFAIPLSDPCWSICLSPTHTPTLRQPRGKKSRRLIHSVHPNYGTDTASFVVRHKNFPALLRPGCELYRFPDRVAEKLQVIKTEL